LLNLVDPAFMFYIWKRLFIASKHYNMLGSSKFHMTAFHFARLSAVFVQHIKAQWGSYIAPSECFTSEIAKWSWRQLVLGFLHH
jgi:hypothetical protein